MAVACTCFADFYHAVVEQNILVLLDAVAVGCRVEIETNEEHQGSDEYQERTTYSIQVRNSLFHSLLTHFTNRGYQGEYLTKIVGRGGILAATIIADATGELLGIVAVWPRIGKAWFLE